jgi:exodeoxyribonuclease VII large subunit
MSSRGRAAALPLPGHPERILTVTQLTRAIKGTLEGAFGVMVVQGELTNFRGPHSSGHYYFALKDAYAQIEVVLYRDYACEYAQAEALKGFQNGIAVQIDGDLTVFEKQGKYQIRALRAYPVGYGALQAKLDALRRRLEEEGLLAPERKRPLPRYPTRIGIVTSDSGAAIRDMERILRERAPYARIVYGHTRVQGEAAAREIAAALDRMNQRMEVDVIIVGRGGGSTQDLWAFNEEALARAILRSRIPVISAVGHESDHTLSDDVADQRAATPTHAAQLVVKDIREIREILRTMREHARRRILAQLQHARDRLQGIETHHVLKQPQGRIREGFQSIDFMQDRLLRALEGWGTNRRSRLQLFAARLRAHAPARSLAHARDRVQGCRRSLGRAVETAMTRRMDRVRHHAQLIASYDHHRVLERGYALVWSGDGGRLRRRGADLRPGDPIQVQFFDARAGAEVTDVTEVKESS